MPELPDVEIYKRYIDSTSLHKRIEHVHVLEDRLLKDVTRQKLSARLVGNKLDGTRRHAKFLAVRAEGDGWLVLHFGMTGDLAAYEDDADSPEYAAMIFDFEDGSHLAYISRRKIGRITWTDDFDAFVEREGLGPDALSFDLGAFRGLVRERRAGIKPLLMNQQAFGGIGNVYSDEILFQAGVRPDRRTDELSDDEIKKLHNALRDVVETAVDRKADPRNMPASWLLPRRKEGADCPRCGGKIRTASTGGRSGYVCPNCQS